MRDGTKSIWNIKQKYFFDFYSKSTSFNKFIANALQSAQESALIKLCF
jgi:hypothetical protein